MRQVKLRAWDKDRGLMYHMREIGTRTVLINKLEQVWEVGVVIHLHNLGKRFEVMLYTGKNDKNSIEICDGDIVEIECECGYRDKMVVEWGYNGYRLKQIWSHRFPSGELELQQLARAEVIGNIYENPRLEMERLE